MTTLRAARETNGKRSIQFYTHETMHDYNLEAGPGCVEGVLKQNDQDLITVNLRISVQ